MRKFNIEAVRAKAVDKADIAYYMFLEVIVRCADLGLDTEEIKDGLSDFLGTCRETEKRICEVWAEETDHTVDTKMVVGFMAEGIIEVATANGFYTPNEEVLYADHN